MCILDIILQQRVSDWHGFFAPLRAPPPDGLCWSDGPAGQIPVKTQTHFSLRLISEKRFQLKQEQALLPLPPHMALYKRNNHEQSSLNSEGTTRKEFLFVLELLSCTSVLNPLAPAWLPVSQNKSGVVSRLLASCPPVAKLECQIAPVQLSPRLNASSLYGTCYFNSWPQ